MSTTDNIPENTESDNADPYGIDHARERRLIAILAALIGGGFILVVIILAVAFALSVKVQGPVIDPPPVIPDQGTAEPADLPINHP